MSVHGPGKVIVKIPAQVPGEQPGLEEWEQGGRHVAAELGVRPEALTAVLPGVEYGAGGRVAGVDRDARTGRSVAVVPAAR